MSKLTLPISHHHHHYDVCTSIYSYVRTAKNNRKYTPNVIAYISSKHINKPRNPPAGPPLYNLCQIKPSPCPTTTTHAYQIHKKFKILALAPLGCPIQ
jgi:hypothetical protein